MATYTNLEDWCNDIAIAIKNKKGTTETFTPAQFPAAIRSIGAGNNDSVVVTGEITNIDVDTDSITINGLSDMSQITGVCIWAFDNTTTENEVMCMFPRLVNGSFALETGGTVPLHLHVIGVNTNNGNYETNYSPMYGGTATFNGSSVTITASRDFATEVYYMIVGTPKTTSNATSASFIGTATSSAGSLSITGLDGLSKITDIFIAINPSSSTTYLVDGLFYAGGCGLNLVSNGNVSIGAMIGDESGWGDESCSLGVGSQNISYDGSTLTLISDKFLGGDMMPTYYTNTYEYVVVGECGSSSSSVTYNGISELCTDIADAIREKTGSTASIVADTFPNAINNI